MALENMDLTKIKEEIEQKDIDEDHRNTLRELLQTLKTTQNPKYIEEEIEGLLGEGRETCGLEEILL